MRYWRLRASLLLLLAVFLPWVEGCSCFIVTSGASQTETLQVTYAADSHTLYGYLQVRIGHGILPGEHLLRLGSCAGLTLGSLSRIYMKTPVRMNTQFFPRSNHSSGDKIKVTDWDSGEYRGVIDQVNTSSPPTSALMPFESVLLCINAPAPSSVEFTLASGAFNI